MSSKKRKWLVIGLLIVVLFSYPIATEIASSEPNGYVINEATLYSGPSYNASGYHIDLDHDAGDYAFDGGDYIEVLKWLEREQLPDIGYTFHLHTMNPVGRDNMRTIINYNGWVESN